MRKLYRGMLISIGVIEACYPSILAEVQEQQCDCHGMGYSDYTSIWFICGYHTGVMDTLRAEKRNLKNLPK